MRVQVLSTVWPDLLESAEWYELEKVNLGVDLLVEVERALEQVGEGPLRYPAVRGEIRRAQVNRFPFGVYFIVRPDCVVVFAINHFSRAPSAWMRRIPPAE